MSSSDELARGTGDAPHPAMLLAMLPAVVAVALFVATLTLKRPA